MSHKSLLILLVAAACGGDDGSNNPGQVDAGPGGNGGVDAPPQTQPDAPVTARDPATDGDATFTSATASIPGTQGRTLPSTVFTPSTPGPRPLVILSPGFLVSREQYTSYAEHLATWGFAVILTSYADSFPSNHTALANDVPRVIDWALANANLAVDPQRIALAGHSLGGKISVFAATLDGRVKAVVGWDPVDSRQPSVAPERMTNLTAKVAVIGETTDATGGGLFSPACAPAADNFTTFYAAAASPALSITVNGADHMDWVDDLASCGTCSAAGCGPGSAPDERARTITRRVNVAWLRRHLSGDTSMDSWLTSPPEVTSGGATVQSK